MMLSGFQMWTSARDNRVATAPVRTQWAPTTVCVTPASRTPTTVTALVRSSVVRSRNRGKQQKA